MGGAKKFPYPLYVWSPAGGWWCNPKAWKKNTMLAFLYGALACVPVFIISSKLERRPVPPYRHIPSQRWCKHAKEDDPSLP